MRLGFKIEFGRLAHDALDAIVRCALADRHGILRDIRDAKEQVGLLAVHHGQLAIKNADLLADRFHLRRLFGHVAALSLECADLLAGAVAFALQGLALLQKLAPLFVELQQLGRPMLRRPAFRLPQPLPKEIGIIADFADVEHGRKAVNISLTALLRKPPGVL